MNKYYISSKSDFLKSTVHVVSDIAKSTKTIFNNTRVTFLWVVQAQREATAENLDLQGSLAPVPASSGVPYLDSQDLNLPSSVPTWRTCGYSEMTIHSSGTHPDCTGNAHNTQCDCWQVSVPSPQPVLDSSQIADMPVGHELGYDCPKSLYTIPSSSYDMFVHLVHDRVMEIMEYEFLRRPQYRLLPVLLP